MDAPDIYLQESFLKDDYRLFPFPPYLLLKLLCQNVYPFLCKTVFVNVNNGIPHCLLHWLSLSVLSHLMLWQHLIQWITFILRGNFSSPLKVHLLHAFSLLPFCLLYRIFPSVQMFQIPRTIMKLFSMYSHSHFSFHQTYS